MVSGMRHAHCVAEYLQRVLTALVRIAQILKLISQLDRAISLLGEELPVC